jgi:hypothetical protein
VEPVSSETLRIWVAGALFSRKLQPGTVSSRYIKGQNILSNFNGPYANDQLIDEASPPINRIYLPPFPGNSSSPLQSLSGTLLPNPEKSSFDWKVTWSGEKDPRVYDGIYVSSAIVWL